MKYVSQVDLAIAIFKGSNIGFKGTMLLTLISAIAVITIKAHWYCASV